MNIDSFLLHHGLNENPFGAEEARHDPLFGRLADSTTTHPDFAKILGQVDRPSTAVVFGEKGSGKTAIRLLIGQRVAEHNAQHPEQRTLLVAYDDLNPVLDRVMERRRHRMGFHRSSKATTDDMLATIRLEDHQDAILSLAATKLIDAILGTDEQRAEAMLLPDKLPKRLKKLPRQTRVNIAILAALYDQPRGGTVAHRWSQIRSKLRLGWTQPMAIAPVLGGMAALVSLVLIILHYFATPDGPEWLQPSGLLLPMAGLAAAAAAVVFGVWGWRHLRLWSLCRKIHNDLLAVDRTASDLRHMLLQLRSADTDNQPWPIHGAGPDGVGHQDSRYQLTARLMNILDAFGYTGMMVLVDRVDEPTLVAGQAQRMRSIVWPMLDNKFLQQDQCGLKLLLPLELRHLLHREPAHFFQEARLDKQNMIDRLTWSGATLYDMCTWRLRVCSAEPGSKLTLSDLFDQDVTRESLVDALDQMHQPRDAFKFLYSILQEHCRMIPDDHPIYRVPKLTLETIRRQQAQRVQELHRGLAPA